MTKPELAAASREKQQELRREYLLLGRKWNRACSATARSWSKSRRFILRNSALMFSPLV